MGATSRARKWRISSFFSDQYWPTEESLHGFVASLFRFASDEEINECTIVRIFAKDHSSIQFLFGHLLGYFQVSMYS